MIQYLLDTNICVHYMKGEYNLIEKVNHAGLETCCISEITIAELLFGVENTPDKYRKKKSGPRRSATFLISGSNSVNWRLF